MRILTAGNMYPPHHLGGYELVWRSAVSDHRAAGHDVRVLTTDWRDSQVDASIPEDRDVHRDLRWYWHDHAFPRLSPSAVLALERHNAASFDHHVADFRPDVVAWWAMGGMSLSLIERARRAGLPAAAIVHDDWLLYGPKVDVWSRRARRAGPLARALEAATGIPARIELGRACRWLFASELLRQRAREQGFRPAMAEVIHPGIDHELFRPRARTRAEWRWQLAYVGRIDERKGIDLAVRALAELPAQSALRIVGRGDETHRAELRAMVQELGLGERVRFEQPSRDDLPQIYEAADAVLFPVRWLEPFGLVPLEAMACGAPVVASGRGGSGEYLRDGENCLLFDVDGGPSALAGAVRRLAGDGALREALHEGGLATATAHDGRSFSAAVLSELVCATRCARSSGSAPSAAAW